MATWTAPSTVHNPTAGLVVPVSWLDAINAAFDLIALKPQAIVSHSTTQSATNSTFKTLLADTETYDNDSMHSTVSNTSRLTCKTKGIFTASATISWAANSTGQRALAFAFNGGTPVIAVAFPTLTSPSTPVMTAELKYNMAVNDYVEACAYQDSGGALNVTLASFALELENFT